MYIRTAEVGRKKAKNLFTFNKNSETNFSKTNASREKEIGYSELHELLILCNKI